MNPSIYTITTDIPIFKPNIVLSILNNDVTQYDALEHFVYETVKYHLNRLNMNTIDAYTVEFWTKNEIMPDDNNRWKTTNNFHVDCDEHLFATQNKMVHPIFTVVSYFSECNYPVLITQIDHIDYKLKRYNNKDAFYLIFPEVNKQVVFDGKYMHGAIDVFNECASVTSRWIIAINIWDHNLTSQTHYVSEPTDILYDKDVVLTHIIPMNGEITEIVPAIEFDYEFYNTMLYDPAYVMCGEIQAELLKQPGKLTNYKFCKKKVISTSSYDMIKTQASDIYNNTIAFNNRFLQRFVIPQLYSQCVCNWIINEAEITAVKRGWSTGRHKEAPTTDIQVEHIPAIFPFVISSFQTIFKHINTLYNLDNAIEYNIKELFIVKYTHDTQNMLEEHQDGQFFTINILLNDTAEFTGGGTTFEDGIHYSINQGDGIVHCGRIKHTGMPITSGKRYLLVAFVGIAFNVYSA